MRSKMHPAMRPNDWKNGDDSFPLPREAEPDTGLLARIERAPFGATSDRKTQLTYGQRDALMPYAEGASYHTIGRCLRIKDVSVMDRIHDGLTTLDKIDGVTSGPIEDRVPATEAEPSSPTSTTYPGEGLASSIADYVQARGYVDISQLWSSEFEPRLEALVASDPDGHPFDDLVSELEGHGVRVDCSPEGWREGFRFGDSESA